MAEVDQDHRQRLPHHPRRTRRAHRHRNCPTPPDYLSYSKGRPGAVERFPGEAGMPGFALVGTRSEAGS